MPSMPPEPTYPLPVYADIDTDIEHLCRYFLDAKLLEFRIRFQESEKYWPRALEFRCQYMGPSDVLRDAYKEAGAKLSSNGKEELLDLKENADAYPAYFQQYLYWFDCRAMYWSYQPEPKQNEDFVTKIETEIRTALQIAESLKSKIHDPKAKVLLDWGGKIDRKKSESQTPAKSLDVDRLTKALKAMAEAGRRP